MQRTLFEVENVLQQPGSAEAAEVAMADNPGANKSTVPVPDDFDWVGNSIKVAGKISGRAKLQMIQHSPLTDR